MKYFVWNCKYNFLGCDNLAIRNPEWEDEYCSNECVVAHCEDVFNDWVAANVAEQESV